MVNASVLSHKSVTKVVMTMVSGLGCQARGYRLLASGYWLLFTKPKILGMNRGFGNMSAYYRNLAAQVWSKKPAARGQ